MIRKVQLLLIIFLFFPVFVSAETIVFKSGHKIEGKIIERTDEYIKIDFYGVPVTHYLDEVETIDGQKPVVVSVKPEILTPQGFPFSTAIITYEYEGYQSGKEVAYIDVAHNKIAIERHISETVLGSTEPKDELDIYDGKTYYQISLTKSMGIKEKREGDAIALIFNEKMYDSYQVQSKKILGKECNMYELPMGNVYFWKGIILKKEINDHPFGEEYNSTQEAIDIQLDVALAAEKFRIPSGIKILTTEEAMKDIGNKFKQLQQRFR